uniref:KRAB domain-containing protein n=1 Tax=Ursus maritimus TaxID=29073 RepID=A0A452U497_URSMA
MLSEVFPIHFPIGKLTSFRNSILVFLFSKKQVSVSKPDLIIFLEQEKQLWDVKREEAVAFHPGSFSIAVRALQKSPYF